MTMIKLFNPFTTSYIDNSISIYLSGQFEYDGLNIHDAQDVKDLILKVSPEEKRNDFSDFFYYDLLEKANGCFSIIIKKSNITYIAVDIIRSHPIFIITTNKKDFVITDSLAKIGINMHTDLAKLEEFVACGLVLGNKTVYKNAIALLAGEGLTIAGKEIISKRYFEFKPAENPETYKNLTEFSNTFDKVLLSAFSRMIDQNPGVNRWVVPLSGGHDSRLIVNYLFKLGVKNVICYSYGAPGNEQARISKMVAEALSYEWHFIEYTPQKWHVLHENQLINEYIRDSFNGVSTPHLQDFLAVFELKKKCIIESGDIFVPGHSCITQRFNENNFCYDSNKEMIHQVYTSDASIFTIQSINNKTIETLFELYKVSNCKLENFRAMVNWQERQCKFNANSIKAYSFFGFDSCLPFWDHKFVRFWLSYPANERRGRKVLFDSEKFGILIDDLQQIPYAGECAVKSTKTGIPCRFKKVIPDNLTVLILRLTKRNTDCNERLNQIYSLEANSVKELLHPVKDFPKQIRPYFKNILYRYPFQVNPNFLTSLFTIKKECCKSKKISTGFLLGNFQEELNSADNKSIMHNGN